MPWYNDLRPNNDEKKQKFGLVFPEFENKDKARTIRYLLKLREYLKNTLPEKSTDKNLLIASWNIKEFGVRYVEKRSEV